MKNQIALIVVYFGPIPHFIRLFLKGCQYNSNVDFWFFTNWDWSSLAEMPNIKNVPFTLGTVVKRIKLYNELIANVI